MIELGHNELSVSTQCALLGLNRGTLYYEAGPEDPLNLELMRVIDEVYTKYPFYGSPRITQWLRRHDYEVNHKRVERLMRQMGIQALYPKRDLELSAPGHRIFPYLLRNIEIRRVNHVWGADITYIRMRHGFLYLVAILDWWSRFVLAWELSNTLDAEFCVRTLDRALKTYGAPEIFNTDQGCQFGSADFTALLENRKVAISMDGRGRAFDNIFVERLWRSVKYEEVYLKDYTNGVDARSNLGNYFRFYNNERYHQSLGYQTPKEVYHAA
jgi:putative transposase